MPRFARGHSLIYNIYEPDKKGIRSSYFLLDNDPLRSCWLTSNRKERNNMEGNELLNNIDEILSYIPNEDYNIWVKVGMALHHSGYDMEVWDNWSKGANNYNEKSIVTQWNSFNNSQTDKPVTQGTIIYYAKQYGYNPPKKAGNYNQDKKQYTSQSNSQAQTKALENYKQQNERNKAYNYIMQSKENVNNTSYLTSDRSLNQNIINQFNLGYDANMNCIVIPWYDPQGNINGYSQRLLIPNGKVRYYKHNVEGNYIPYNVQALYTAQPDNIIICEGEIDCLSIIQAGGNGVALKSTQFIDKFINIIKGSQEARNKTYIISLDNDTTGIEASEQLQKGLEAHNIKSVVFDVLTDYSKGKCYNDHNEFLVNDRDTYTRNINNLAGLSMEELKEIQKENERLKNLGEYTNKNQASRQRENFLHEVENNNTISTGIKELDQFLGGGLYKGLYCIGAVSSLGKTTFTLQLADSIAKQKTHDVLIFSLEMSRNEILSKSLSRYSYILAAKDYKVHNAITNRQFLNSDLTKDFTPERKKLMNDSMDYYFNNIAERIYIIEGVGMNVDTITEKIKKHIELTGNKPIVIIDYLQAIFSTDNHLSDKQVIDQAVFKLKQASRDNELTVITISSLNRTSYTSKVDMSSFKESGAIEYTSDILLGLDFRNQYTPENKREKDSETKVNASAHYKNEKAKYPRELSLSILKNRNGMLQMNDLNIDYYTSNNYFKFNIDQNYTKPQEPKQQPEKQDIQKPLW